MAVITDYAPYVIFFHDRAQYEFAIAAVGGDADNGALYNRCPVAAANAFGITYPFATGNMDLIPNGVYYVPPFVPGFNLNSFAPPNVILQDNVDWFDVPGYPGSAGRSGTGAGRRIAWSGSLVYMAKAAPNDVATPTPIPQRRWFGGMEVAFKGEGATTATNGRRCRDASRTIDGFGYALRGNDTNVWKRLTNEYQVGFTTLKSWERFYIRVRRLPSGTATFWRCHGFPSAAEGGGLQLLSTGVFRIVNINSSDVTSVLATDGTPVEIDKWYKFDVFLEYKSTATSGNIQVFRNGIQIFSVNAPSMSSNTNHASSELGNTTAPADVQVEIDFDDWMNAEWPLNAGALAFDSIDFLMGSHIRIVQNFAGTVTNWTPVGAWSITNQGQSIAESQVNSALSSSTSGAVIALTCNVPALGVQDKVDEVTIGAVAIGVSALTTNGSATDGQLGYSLAGAANVMATIDETGSIAWRKVAYRPSGLTIPLEITPLVIRYTKSADAAAVSVLAMQAFIEYIGIWGQEDCVDPDLYPEDRPRKNWLHNCRYPNTPYGVIGPTLNTAVYAVGGIYAGNGTQQEITLPDACHLIFIRGITGGSSGIKFFGSSVGGHKGSTEWVYPQAPVQMYYDSLSQTFKFTVTGTNLDSNAIGTSYQYIAFCDPGMRYCSGGAYLTPPTVTSRVNNLQNPGLTPEFAFVQRDSFSGSNTEGLWCKGPGNSGTTGNNLNAPGLLTNFGTFGLGTITTGVDLHTLSIDQYNYLAFRSAEPGCGWVMLQILTYTGNGLASRVIPLTPACGCFPLFALIVPTSGAQTPIFRDPSHAGLNSSQFTNPGSSITTGITAGGVDSITVGIALNANAIVYNVFVIPGSSLGWNNGTFYPQNCLNEDPYFTPEMAPPEIAVMGDGGVSLSGEVPLTLLKDISGIYTLTPNKTNDTLYDRQTGQTSVDMKIPNPKFKTGYIGG